ncbi:MAG: hypothetical protein AAB674_00360 [Patescibacteria group bacterium]
MPELSQPKFEQPIIEKDIERISKEIWEQRKIMPDKKISEREIVRSVIGAQIQAAKPAPLKGNSALPKYLEGESLEIKTKVEELVAVAFQKGLDFSINEAKKFGPFILDALHDALTSKVYDELKNKGKLK